MLLLVCLLGLGLLALLDASLNRTRGLCPRQLQGDFHRLAAPGTRAAALTLSMQQFDEVMLHCRAPPHSARAALALRCALCTGDATAAGQRALQALDRDLQGPGPAHWTGTVLPAVLRAGDVATVLWLGAGPYAVVLGQALLMEGGMVLVTADPRPERRGYGGTTHVQVPPDDLCAALLPSTFDLVLLHDAPLGLPRALWSGRLLQCLTSLLKPAAWLYVQHRGAEDDLVSDGAMRDLGLEARAFPDVPGPECAGREFCGRFYRASARAHDAAAGPAGVGAAAVAPGQSGGAAFVADPTALHTRRSLRPPGALHHQREAARLRCALCTRPLVSAGETRRRALAALERRWDRKQLNTRVLPAVARANLSLVLWVGTQPYTLGYNDLFLFGSDSVLVTDDPVPASALFGAGAHFQALVQDLCAVVANGTFDAVLLHGVFGRGLTQKADQMAFLTCAAALLRPAGVLYLGYNFSPRASRVKAVPVGVAKGYAKDTWSAALGALGFVREAFGEQPGQVCTDGRGGDGYGRGFCMEFWTLRKGE